MSNKALSGAVVFLLLLSLPAHTQKKPFQEQTEFSCEQDTVGAPIRRPVRIPPPVLELLTSSENARTCERSGSGLLPADWFIASEIHLSGGKRADMIVQQRFLPEPRFSENECLFGGNIGPFWIFRRTLNGYEMVLDSRTHSLSILNTKTKGLRDIRVVSSSAAQFTETTLKFDGKKYTAAKSKTESIK